jgi:hypothetical protein
MVSVVDVAETNALKSVAMVATTGTPETSPFRSARAGRCRVPARTRIDCRRPALTGQWRPASLRGFGHPPGGIMRRISIRSLMAFVLAFGVAVAALRNADDDWASGMILATPALFGVALIGAVCGEERSRARRLGFAILGGGYFALAFTGLSHHHMERLPTSRILNYIHQQVVPGMTATFTVTTGGPFVTRGVSAVPNASPATVYVVTSPAAPPVSTPGIAATGRWSSLLPGAANLESFSTVGHCLFALVAGLVGGTLAVWFRGRREGSGNDAAPSSISPSDRTPGEGGA